jgi:DNA polymerase-3 subunit gamma/tau
MGLGARIDRLERRLDISGTPASASAPAPAPLPAQDHPATRPALGNPVQTDAESPATEEVAVSPPAPPTADPRPEDTAPAPAPAAEAPAAEKPPAPPATQPTAPAPTGALTLVDVRRLWPDIVEATKVRRRMAWIHLSQNCQVVGLEGTTLTLGFTNAGARDSFVSSGCPDVVREAAIDVVGADWKIDTIVDPGAQPDATVVVKSATEPAAPAEAEAKSDPAPEVAPEDSPQAPPATSAARNAARDAIKDTRPAGTEVARSDDLRAADADADRDDLVVDEATLGSEDLLARELGAQMIEEIPHT